jgi:hypothetical protein
MKIKVLKSFKDKLNHQIEYIVRDEVQKALVKRIPWLAMASKAGVLITGFP